MMEAQHEDGGFLAGRPGHMGLCVILMFQLRSRNTSASVYRYYYTLALDQIGEASHETILQTQLTDLGRSPVAQLLLIK
jgi:hypothetical protein